MAGTVNDTDLLVSRHSDLLNANKTIIQRLVLHDDDLMSIREGAKKRFVRFFQADNFKTQSYDHAGTKP